MTKDEEILGVWSEFFVGHALSIRAIETLMAGKAPLSLDEYDVMLCISRYPGQRTRFSALAEATIYTRSGISRIMKRLEKAGYVRREKCPEDRRGSYAALTDSGRQALKETWRWYSAAIIKLLEPCFSLSEAQKLREFLSRIVEVLCRPELVQIRSAKQKNKR